MDDAAATSDLPDLRGGRVLLRSPRPGDALARAEVRADAELHRMYGGSGAPRQATLEELERGLAELANQDLATMRWFLIAALVWPDGLLVDEPDGRYIGHVRLTIQSWDDRRARLAIGIYDRRFWSHGYGTEAVRLVLRYAFEHLGLHRIELAVIEYNARAIRCYEKCGFVHEGIERESALVDGRWFSDLRMSILEHEYRAQAWAAPVVSTDGA